MERPVIITRSDAMIVANCSSVVLIDGRAGRDVGSERDATRLALPPGKGEAMQFNFFAWVRDGVKQAILLGVSEAVEQIGAPLDGNDLNQKLAEALQPAALAASEATGKPTSKRKRLGRSLKDIDKNDA